VSKKALRASGTFLLLTLSTTLWSATAQVPKTAPSTAATKPSPQALRILSDMALEAPLKNATDVRWANGHSVVLALRKDGVVEYDLDGKSSPKKMISGEGTPGGFWDSHHIGISSRYLVVGAWLFTMTWRPLDSAMRNEEAFDGIHDLDVYQNRVAVVGARRNAEGDYAPDGAIAWIGSLDKNLSDLKPLIFDAGGAGAPNMGSCASFFLGAVRFLTDGSLVVVPGVQPGIDRFDPQGKLIKTLDTVALGIDTDCSSIGKDMSAKMAHDVPRRLAWINQRRTVDDILPLPAGPGLLIRSVQQGEVRWMLKVLYPDGKVAVYDVPIHAQNAFSHLKGDFRQGRLVLLLWGNPPDRNPEHAPLPHLLIVAPPVASPSVSG
jgi:hypothetical protein